MKYCVMIIICVSLIGCATNEKSSERAKRGAVTSGAVGMIVGGPQRAVVGAAAGAAARVVGGEALDRRKESSQ